MLNSDTLIERNFLRRKLSFWRTLAIIIVVLLFIKIAAGSGAGKFGKLTYGPYVARITISDIIDKDVERDEKLKELAEDKDVKAVILDINSPGGTAVGGETLYKALKKLNEKKPVVTVMNSMATSAAYMAPLGTSRIYAHNGTITGSIGVIMQMPNVKELTDKMGVKFDTVKTAPLKASPSPFETTTPEAIEVLHNMVMDFYGYFIKVVSEERKIDLEEVRKLADGRIYSGLEAQKLKLVDEVGTEEDALAWLVENNKLAADIKIEEYPLKDEPSALDGMLGAVSNLKQFTLIPESFKLKGLVSVWQ